MKTLFPKILTIVLLALLFSCNFENKEKKSIEDVRPIETLEQKELCLVGTWVQENREKDSSIWKLEVSKHGIRGIESDGYIYNLLHIDKLGRTIVEFGLGTESDYGRWKIQGNDILFISMLPGTVQRKLQFTNCSRIIYKNIIFIRTSTLEDNSQTSNSEINDIKTEHQVYEIKTIKEIPVWANNLDRVILGDYVETENLNEEILGLIGNSSKKPINYNAPYDEFFYININEKEYFLKLIEQRDVNGKNNSIYSSENIKITIEYDQEAPTHSGFGWGGTLKLYVNDQLIKNTRINIG